MDTLLIPLMDGPVDVMAVPPSRKRWTRTKCDALEASGLLAGEHLELIDGDLVNKMGKNRPHVLAVALVYEWLRSVFGWEFVQTEAPIDVALQDNGSSEPEPDLAVLRRPGNEFQLSNPGPDDVLLVIEVSDSTLYLKTKAALYARAGIADFWVLDIASRRLIVHRNPTSGGYTAIHVYGEQEPVSPLAAPHAEFRAVEALPAK